MSSASPSWFAATCLDLPLFLALAVRGVAECISVVQLLLLHFVQVAASVPLGALHAAVAPNVPASIMWAGTKWESVSHPLVGRMSQMLIMLLLNAIEAKRAS